MTMHTLSAIPTRLRSARTAGLAVLILLWLGAAPASSQPTEVIEYYGVDAIGSIRVVFDSTGAVVARSDYLPFGESFTPSGAMPSEQFTGQARDGEAGLDYFGARYMQPRHGRFATVDPASGRMLDPQQWNRYSYVRNTPGTFVDPDGRLAMVCTGIRGDASSFNCLYTESGYSFNLGGVTYIWTGGDITRFDEFADQPYMPYIPDLDTGRGFNLGGATGGNSNTGVDQGGGINGDGTGGSGSGPDVTSAGGTSTGGTDGGGANGTDSRSESAEKESLKDKVLRCTTDHYGLGGLMGRGAVAAASIRFPKEWAGLPFYEGTSRFTHPLSVLQHYVAPDSRVPFRFLGTAAPLRMVGRAAPFIGAALAAYDVYSIGSCAFK